MSRSSSGPGRVGHARDHVVDGGLPASGVELPRHADRVGVHPGAQQVEPPQAPRDRLGGPVRPGLGDHLDALGVGEVEHPLGDLVVAGGPGTAHQQLGRAVGRLGEQHRVVAGVEPAEEAVARRERAVVRALGHAPTVAGIGRAGPGNGGSQRPAPPSRCGAGAVSVEVGARNRSEIARVTPCWRLVGIERVPDSRCCRSSTKNRTWVR